ncbi:hypothetical protein SAMN06265795_12846 [Noviherbaspirillum humi]|uniref:Uncharacterized protein n=1 Tax=Noviherbaspirillum humi TaxID=1688639 RepID=A0A239LZK1_9BURK|nr:hypothetical protein [Noviherbaspirillum humi]SNT35835.1 hypothetical protein SAMN06265795_12846 [Noviherbaspirillum humi]
MATAIGFDKKPSTAPVNRPHPSLPAGGVNLVASGGGEISIDVFGKSWNVFVNGLSTLSVAAASALLSLSALQIRNLVQSAFREKALNLPKFGTWLLDSYALNEGQPVYRKDKTPLTDNRGRPVLRDGKGLYVVGEKDSRTGLRPKMRLPTKSAHDIDRFESIPPKVPGFVGPSNPSGSGCILRTMVHEIEMDLFLVTGIGENRNGGLVTLDAEIIKDPFGIMPAEAHAQNFGSVMLNVDNVQLGGSVVFHIRCDGAEKPSDTATIELNEE